MRALKPESPSLADNAPHLLVVDDDRRIRDLLSRFLFSEGYRVTTAESAAEARAKLAGLRFDLMILDVMMPGETGFDFARSLRSSSDVPILMLTARAEPESRINGLEIGADDYVGKPFEPRELSLRVANILKRTRVPSPRPVESVRFGDFIFHLDRGELRRGEEIVHLTDREREMLRVLAAYPGDTVTRPALSGGGSFGERAVDVQVNRLRRKVERDPANPLLIQTVRGIGYRLVTSP
jgi:two-component system phosphate regulon response regulator OmpR